MIRRASLSLYLPRRWAVEFRDASLSTDQRACGLRIEFLVLFPVLGFVFASSRILDLIWSMIVCQFAWSEENTKHPSHAAQTYL